MLPNVFDGVVDVLVWLIQEGRRWTPELCVIDLYALYKQEESGKERLFLALDCSVCVPGSFV